MSSPKDFHMDAVYPEPLSRLRRGMPNSDLPSSASYRRAVKKQIHRSSSGRFRTQPVTFHEIKEVDEENLTEVEIETTGSIGAESKSESDLKAKFELFYRSISTNNENQMPQRRNQLSIIKSGEEEVGDGHNMIYNPTSSISLADRETLPGIMTKDNSSSSHTTTTTPLVIPFNQKSRPSL